MADEKIKWHKKIIDGLSEEAVAIVVVVLLGVVLVYAYMAGWLHYAHAKVTGGGSGGTSGGGSGGSTSACPKQVSPLSPANCIMQAFQASGYWAALEADNNPTYIAQATADPAGWMRSHPYLYSAYPEYFKLG